MVDISMCANPTCPMSRWCHRHEFSGTKPSVWQSYMNFQWSVGDDGKPSCADFWCVKT